MKWCYFCFVLLLAGSCTLTSSQEASLHQAVTSYVDAHNNGAVMAYVGFTHPYVVGYYENQGDSIFRQKFELFDPKTGGDFIQDGNVKEIEKGANQIHVHYVFDSYKESDFKSERNDLGLIAISLDQGLTWFFVEVEDYTNDNIFSKDEQLIAL